MKKEERKLITRESQENIWWYNFYKILGFKAYDIEYANNLRIDGVDPEVAAEISRI